MKRAHSLSMPVLGVVAAALLAGCDGRPPNDERVLNERVIAAGDDARVTAEIWVDNWFSLSVNGAPVIEDSVPFPTERSFNAERVTFTASFPMTVAFEFRDFVENDTGLEYIGTNRQQIGDGGAIAQFIDADTGAILKGTDSTWKCLVIHHAPVDAACAGEDSPSAGQGACDAVIRDAPAGWTRADFDDRQWPFATEHPQEAVSPKGGYDAIEWAPEATLIWGADLKLDNTVICRTVIDRP